MFSLICQKHEGLTAFFSFARAPSVISFASLVRLTIAFITILVFFLAVVCFQFFPKMKISSYKAKSLGWNGAFSWRAEGDKFYLSFSIGCAFCPMRLATVLTQGLSLVFSSRGMFPIFSSNENFLIQGKVPGLKRYVRWNRGVFMASRRGQILFAVLYWLCVLRHATCHCFNTGILPCTDFFFFIRRQFRVIRVFLRWVVAIGKSVPALFFDSIKNEFFFFRFFFNHWNLVVWCFWFLCYKRINFVFIEKTEQERHYCLSLFIIAADQLSRLLMQTFNVNIQ